MLSKHEKMRVIASPDGTFYYDRNTGMAIVDNSTVTKEWIKPFYAQVAITSKCNMQPPCPWCYANAGSHGIHYPLNELIEIVKVLDKWGLFGVSYSGGEPFTYPKLTELVRWTREETGLDVSLTTNGFATKKQIDNVEDYLGEIRMSLYYPHQLTLLSSFMNRKFDFGVNLLLLKNRAKYLILLLLKAYSLGVRDFLINEFVPVGRGKKVDLTPTPRDYSLLARFLCSLAPADTQIKVNTKLLTLLQKHNPNRKTEIRGIPFNDRKLGRIIAITVNREVKLSSLSEKGLRFRKPVEIPHLYKQLVEAEKNE